MSLRIATYGRLDCFVTAGILIGVAGAVTWLGPRLGPAWLAWVAVVPGLLAAFAVSFYRDPDRPIPREPDLLVSPADGVVTDIATVQETEYLDGPALRIGIFLSPLNVHVNRSPVAGTVEKVLKKDGKCLPATGPRCIDENASNLVGIRAANGSRVAVRQVTGALARRIVCPLAPGRPVERGERIGMIKLGSRTELLVPADAGFVAQVRVGDVVRGGSSVLGRWAPVGAGSGTARDAAQRTQEVAS